MINESPNQPAAAYQPCASTGPRTAAGKSASSQNARKHDLCSRTLRLTPGEWVEYNEMCERYRRDLRPANHPEQTLVDEICFNYWRLQQAREVELKVISDHPTDLPVISLYIRYRTGYERGFYKALDRLGKLQAETRKRTDLPVRSAEPVIPPKPERVEVNMPASTVQAAPAPLAAAPLAAVCSANSTPGKSEELQEQIEDYLLENRVRAELLLPPLSLPKPLRKQVKQFISQNPTSTHAKLNDLLKKAA